jgi:hypothetical protein
VALTGVDKGVVVRGAGIGLAVLVPPVAIVRALLGNDDDSPLWTIVPLAFLLAFPLAGGVAARRAPTAPLAHGALAAAAAFGVALLGGIVRNLVAGWSMTLAAFVTGVLFWQIAISLGVLGAYLAGRRRPSPEVRQP